MNKGLAFIILCFCSWCICILLGNLTQVGFFLAIGTIELENFSTEKLATLISTINADQLRVFVGLNHFFSFLLPGMLVYTVSRRILFDNPIGPQRKTSWSFICLAFLFFMLSLPVTLYLNFLAMELPWPEYFQQIDSDVYALMGKLLASNQYLDLVWNILIIGILVGAGEELVFRGLIQGNLEKIINVHVAIVLTSLFFALIHLQADGMVARFMLGIVLGYIYFFSRNIWIPILLHAFYNGSQVAIAQLSGMAQSLESETQQNPGIPWYIALVSIVLTLGVARYWYQYKVRYE